MATPIACNDNLPFIDNPRMAVHGTWVGDQFTPDCTFHKIGKEEMDAKAAASRKAERVQRIRIGKRSEIGKDWDGKADNDNINWPLAKALLAEGNGELLKYAMRYRQIHGQAHSGAQLGGTTYTAKEGRVIDYVSKLDESTGVISYEKARKSRSVDAVATAPARRKNITNETTMVASSPVPKPWNGDMAVNNMLDAQPLLERLRRALGAIVEPFELAVVDGATYEAVGRAAGSGNKIQAMGAGRAVVHMGLMAIQTVLGNVNRGDLAA